MIRLKNREDIAIAISCISIFRLSDVIRDRVIHTLMGMMLSKPAAFVFRVTHDHLKGIR